MTPSPSANPITSPAHLEAPQSLSNKPPATSEIRDQTLPPSRPSPSLCPPWSPSPRPPRIEKSLRTQVPAAGAGTRLKNHFFWTPAPATSARAGTRVPAGVEGSMGLIGRKGFLPVDEAVPPHQSEGIPSGQWGCYTSSI
ncbi:hypothetical protein PGTUg99_018383 [Puccinia graminis f. sp. tritici]|uniref:Uncharacterized protein n=1 Tax=Puccinia graminis f. sp. tritici TaxID=56615 RepID=A0A5B0RFR1_PUCGR|nr:hypothetical protein PGTUg99_018383 [Puccinia graminis f. sp. tritici]